MAWPVNANLTAYVANSTPAIKATDLNQLQTRVVDLFGGRKSIVSLTVDATGDLSGTAASGEVHTRRLLGLQPGGTVTAGGGAGIGATAPTYSITSVCGWFQINCAGAPAAGTLASVRFNASNVFALACVPTVSAANATAGRYLSESRMYVSQLVNGFDLIMAAGGGYPVAGNQLVFTFVVAGIA